MKSLVAASASGVCFALAILSATSGSRPLRPPARRRRSPSRRSRPSSAASARSATTRRSWRATCRSRSSTSPTADRTPVIAERMITKLRAGMMPPPGTEGTSGRRHADRCSRARSSRCWTSMRRPSPEPGARTFQRLNRAEYERSIKDLLGLDVDAGKLAAARHEERQLRQHRRRADAVGDARSTRTSTRRARSASSRSATRTRRVRTSVLQGPAPRIAVGARRRRARRHARRRVRHPQLSGRRRVHRRGVAARDSDGPALRLVVAL